LLERELRAFLADVLRGDFFAKRLPEGPRQIQDVAISGNGEPTSCENFTEAVGVIGRVLADEGLLGKLPIVLITNGSLVHKSEVQRGLAACACAMASSGTSSTAPPKQAPRA
jgi:wyosine [tRNA(Phe)-imidazoG37] synthetase (radical SAM superfamily)